MTGRLAATTVSADAPDATVVVPTKNAARTLAPWLESLGEQFHLSEGIVVETGSTDATQRRAERGADHFAPFVRRPVQCRPCDLVT